MTKMILIKSYAALRDNVRKTLLLGQQKIEEAKVRAYWETGRFINQHIQMNGGRAEYGQKIVRRLAEDIELDYSVLQRCSQFAEMFPDFKIVAARRQLTWAHYRALLAVPDEKKRLALMKQAEDENWVSRDLEIEVRNLNWEIRAAASEGKPPSLLPVPVLGPFYTYQIIAPETIHSRATEPLLDVGFSHTIKLSRFTPRKFGSARAVKSSADGTWDMGHKYNAGAIVTSVKGAQDRYSLRSIPSPRPLPKGEDKGEGALSAVPRTPDDLLYTYKAFVMRVIDGDTLKLEIDTGFDEQCRETIRLRGIDCPEMNTPEGRAAKRFVERELAHCESIILKSTQTRKEKWGRYLGDVFYTDKAGKQQYLNNVLLEKGYAVRVRE